MATIISVSLGQGQKEFIDEMGISPSELLQRSINDIFESSKVSQKMVRELQDRISRLAETIKKQGDFIEEQGLTDLWLKYNGY